MQLRKYQKFAVGQLVLNSYFGLFLDMGLGKTRIVLEAIKYLSLCGINEKFLIIAPKRVCKYVWEQEARKWKMPFIFSHLTGTPEQRVKNIKEDAHIYLLSTDLVTWLYETKFYKEFKYVVIDEISMFRNTTTNRFKVLKKMRANIKVLWGLTGTPAPNGLENLWGIIYLLDRGKRLGKYKKTFQEKYMEMAGFISQYRVRWKLCPGAECMIYEKIKDICVSMKSEDYIELPDFQTNIIYTDFNNSEYDYYQKFVRDKLLRYEKGDLVAKNAATLISKCQQFSNGHTYLDSGEVERQHTIKLDALAEFCECCGSNILLFYNFITDRDAILTSIPGAEMLDVQKWNKGQQKIALVHPKTGGYGLNLQAGGNILLWYSPIWDLEMYQQAIKRLHRPGQTSKVLNYIIVMKKTVDEKILKALDKKKITQDELLEMVKATSLSGTSIEAINMHETLSGTNAKIEPCL